MMERLDWEQALKSWRAVEKQGNIDAEFAKFMAERIEEKLKEFPEIVAADPVKASDA